MELPNGIHTTSTLSGLSVVLYTLRAGGGHPIHGAYYNGSDWVIAAWTAQGKMYDDNKPRWLDLIVSDELYSAIKAETTQKIFAPNPQQTEL